MDTIIKMLDKSLEYVSHELIYDTLYISVVSNKEILKCFECGSETSKVHSRFTYTR